MDIGEIVTTKNKSDFNFKLLKEKIISTDELIKTYQKKCNDCDGQKQLVRNLQEKLQRCFGETGSLRLNLQKAIQSVEPLRKTARNLEWKNSALDIENKKLVTKIELLEVQIKGSQKGAEEHISQINTLQESKKKLEKDLKSSQKKAEKINKEKCKLAEKIDELRTKSRESAIHGRAVTFAEKKLKEAKIKIAKLESKLREGAPPTQRKRRRQTRKPVEKYSSDEEDVPQKKYGNICMSDNDQGLASDCTSTASLQDSDVEERNINIEKCCIAPSPPVSPLPDSPEKREDFNLTPGLPYSDSSDSASDDEDIVDYSYRNTNYNVSSQDDLLSQLSVSSSDNDDDDVEFPDCGLACDEITPNDAEAEISNSLDINEKQDEIKDHLETSRSTDLKVEDSSLENIQSVHTSYIRSPKENVDTKDAVKTDIVSSDMNIKISQPTSPNDSTILEELDIIGKDAANPVFISKKSAFIKWSDKNTNKPESEATLHNDKNKDEVDTKNNSQNKITVNCKIVICEKENHGIGKTEIENKNSVDIKGNSIINKNKTLIEDSIDDEMINNEKIAKDVDLQHVVDCKNNKVTYGDNEASGDDVNKNGSIYIEDEMTVNDYHQDLINSKNAVGINADSSEVDSTCENIHDTTSLIKEKSHRDDQTMSRIDRDNQTNFDLLTASISETSDSVTKKIISNPQENCKSITRISNCGLQKNINDACAIPTKNMIYKAICGKDLKPFKSAKTFLFNEKEPISMSTSTSKNDKIDFKLGNQRVYPLLSDDGIAVYTAKNDDNTVIVKQPTYDIATIASSSNSEMSSVCGDNNREASHHDTSVTKSFDYNDISIEFLLESVSVPSLSPIPESPRKRKKSSTCESPSKRNTINSPPAISLLENSNNIIASPIKIQDSPYQEHHRKNLRKIIKPTPRKPQATIIKRKASNIESTMPKKSCTPDNSSFIIKEKCCSEVSSISSPPLLSDNERLKSSTVESTITSATSESAKELSDKKNSSLAENNSKNKPRMNRKSSLLRSTNKIITSRKLILSTNQYKEIVKEVSLSTLENQISDSVNPVNKVSSINSSEPNLSDNLQDGIPKDVTPLAMETSDKTILSSVESCSENMSNKLQDEIPKEVTALAMETSDNTILSSVESNSENICEITPTATTVNLAKQRSIQIVPLDSIISEHKRSEELKSKTIKSKQKISKKASDEIEKSTAVQSNHVEEKAKICLLPIRSKTMSELCYAKLILERIINNDTDRSLILQRLKSTRCLSNAMPLVSAIISWLKSYNNIHVLSLVESNLSDNTSNLHHIENGLLSIVLTASGFRHLNGLAKGLLHLLPKTIVLEETLTTFARTTLCRFYTAICRTSGNPCEIHAFIVDLFFCEKTYIDAVTLFGSCLEVWRDILPKTSFNDKEKKNTPNCPISTVLILLVLQDCRKRKLKKIEMMMTGLANGFSLPIEDCEENVLDGIVSDLLYFLRKPSPTADSYRCHETCCAIRLLATRQSIEWCNNVMIGRHLWNLLLEWVSHYVISMNQNDVNSKLECATKADDLISDDGVALVIRLIGSVSQLCIRRGFHDFKFIHATLVDFLLSTITNFAVCEKVQFATCHTIFDLMPSDNSGNGISAIIKYYQFCLSKSINLPQDLYEKINIVLK